MVGQISAGVDNAADRGLDARFGQPFGVANGHVLAATIAVMDQAGPMQRPPLVQRLFQRIEHKARMRGA